MPGNIGNGKIIRAIFPGNDWKDLLEYLSCKEVYMYEPGDVIDENKAKELCKDRAANKAGMEQEGHLHKNIFFKKDNNGKPL
jgi:hypothetical protein